MFRAFWWQAERFNPFTGRVCVDVFGFVGVEKVAMVLADLAPRSMRDADLARETKWIASAEHR